jgi:hypothetical protein
MKAVRKSIPGRGGTATQSAQLFSMKWKRVIEAFLAACLTAASDFFDQ